MDASIATPYLALDAADGSSDAELMAATREGDREAFGELVERHKDALVGYLLRLTGCRDRAEDLAQDAFLRLFHSAARSSGTRYRERGQFTAYLFRIATNLLRSEERRRRIARRLALGVPASEEEVARVADPGPSSDEVVLGLERRRRLTQAIARLPLRYRVPLVLFEIEEWSIDEIARLLGAKQGTVKSRLFRARARLRGDLETWFEGGTNEGSEELEPRESIR